MSDGYDYYCFYKLSETMQQALSPGSIDEITCACADYLQAEGYRDLPGNFVQKQPMSSAAQIVPNRSNQLSS